MTNTTELMQRLEAKAAERAKTIDQVMRILWESGEQSADWEGGAPPSWDDITAGRQRRCGDDETPEGKELNDAYTSYYHCTWTDAQHLLALDHKQCLALAQILIAEAQRKTEEHEIRLWRGIERAAGYEAGSLTGKPGVKQQVFCV